METENISKLIQNLCKVSMCDPISDTDFDNIDDSYKDTSKEHFIVEFGVTDPTILVTVGQKIYLGDTIAIMDNIPVKSKNNGEITEVYDRYIVGKYTTDIEELLSQYNLSEKTTDKDIMKQFNLNL